MSLGRFGMVLGNRNSASVSSIRRTERNPLHQFAQVGASSFVTDPARDTNVQAHVQIGIEILTPPVKQWITAGTFFLAVLRI